MNRYRFYFALLAALLVLYAVAEAYRPQPTDWSYTYRNRDKIPFGTYALVELLPDLLGKDLKVTREAMYTQIIHHDPAALQAALYTADDAEEGEEAAVAAMTDTATAEATDAPEAIGTDTTSAAPDTTAVTETEPAGSVLQVDTTNIRQTTTPVNYLFVNTYFSGDDLDLRALLAFAAAGNHVFIAAESLPAALLQKLHLRAVTSYDDAGLHLADSADVRLVAGPLAGRRFRYARTDVTTELRQDTARAPGLRTLARTLGGKAVLVTARFGHGDFTICTVPVAFTNYHLLRPATTDFALAALATLPPGPTWWDEFLKQGPEGEQSVFRVIHRFEALRLAFYLLLLGGALLLWIGGRRRQRIIPVIKPLPNNTLQFVTTVAALYRQGDNHALIAHRKIDLFLEFLRNRYQEKTDNLAADDFRDRLSQKSGLPRADVDHFFRRVAEWRTSDWVGEGELLQLSRMLHEFRRR